MKRTQKTISYIPDEECYRTDMNELRAYFFTGHTMAYYQFQNKREMEEWKIKRSRKNRIDMWIEDFQACDDEGFFSHKKMTQLKKTMGIAIKKPTSVAEMIGQCEAMGQDLDYDMIDEIETAKEKPVKKKLHKLTIVRKDKLQQLIEETNLPFNMAELFLQEIKLSTDNANKHLRDRAKMLGIF